MSGLIGSIGETSVEALNNLCWFMRVHALTPIPGTFRHAVLKPGIITDAQGQVIANTLMFGETGPLHRMEVGVESSSVGPS